eukprot:GFUD01139154.1.p1 GENE.GFUD01139154.1~~GFUD01139154.1.p1  ORF type:complete len:222 (-),score=48.45 GFUD01139154.1:17-622(-)
MTHLQSILEFIYTGEVEVAEKDLSEVLEAAFDLKIKGLSDRQFPIQEKEYKPNPREGKVGQGYEQTDVSNNIALDAIEEELESIFALKDEVKMSSETDHNNSDNIVAEQTDTKEFDLQVEGLMVSSFDPFNGKIIWKCAKCNYSPKIKHTLMEHVETHIDGISYGCSTCDKTFGTRNSLRVHKIRQHDNKKKLSRQWSLEV